MTANTDKATCERIYVQWHEYARAREGEKLLGLYADDAVLETPLVPAIFDTKTDGVLRGRAEIKHFFDEGLRRRPDALLRWYRTGTFFTDGRTLIWEYPRETPNGDQIDILEVMEIEKAKIKRHRIYWGWLGFQLLFRNARVKTENS